VTLQELLKSVPQLSEEDKDRFCVAFKKTDDDGENFDFDSICMNFLTFFSFARVILSIG
jgi:hypothetical protein